MRKRAFEVEIDFWTKLSNALDIHYIPNQDAKGSWQHRLIGCINGFPIVVRYGQSPQVTFDFYAVLVRYSPLMDANRIEQILLKNAELIEIRGKLKAEKKAFVVRENFAFVAIRYNRKKDNPVEIADKIQIFVNLLSIYARPMPMDVCEAEDCKSRLNAQTNLVFVNEFPQLLCETCIAEIPKWGKKAQDEFQKVPARLFRGIAAGLGVAFLGSVVGALLSVFLDGITAILAPIILTVIIKIMDKVGTKRTIWSVLSAALLSFLGVIFGTYLSIILYMIKEYSTKVTLDLLISAWESLWLNPDTLNIPIFLSFLVVVPWLWLVWSNTRAGLSKAFNPKVEILDTNLDNMSHTTRT